MPSWLSQPTQMFIFKIWTSQLKGLPVNENVKHLNHCVSSWFADIFSDLPLAVLSLQCKHGGKKGKTCQCNKNTDEEGTGGAQEEGEIALALRTALNVLWRQSVCWLTDWLTEIVTASTYTRSPLSCTHCKLLSIHSELNGLCKCWSDVDAVL